MMNIKKPDDKGDDSDKEKERSAGNAETSESAEVHAAMEFTRGVFSEVLDSSSLPIDSIWETIRACFPSPGTAIRIGRESDIPESLIQRFAFETIVEHISRKDFGFIARFMKGMNIGTPIQQMYFKKLGEQQKVAKQQRARQEVEDTGSKRNYVLLFPDATIDDLVDEFESPETLDNMDDIFFTYVDDNYPDRKDELIDIIGTPAASTITVIDFFDQDLESLTEDLPIKFVEEDKAS